MFFFEINRCDLKISVIEYLKNFLKQNKIKNSINYN